MWAYSEIPPHLGPHSSVIYDNSYISEFCDYAFHARDESVFSSSIFFSHDSEEAHRKNKSMRAMNTPSVDLEQQAKFN